MSFFNRIVGLFKKAALPTAQPSITAPKVRTLREYTQDLLRQSFKSSGRLSAMHCTSHRTVSMDLRDARKRRNIEKRKSR